MTQAYAVTDDHQILCILDNGTTDYRTAALQFGYDIDSKSRFVLQRELLVSPSLEKSKR